MTLFKVSVNYLQYMHVHVVAWNLKTVDLLPKKENKSNSNIDTYMKKVRNFKKTTVQLSVS